MLALLFLALCTTVLAKREKSSWNRDDQFCGENNCYELLGVAEESSKSVIKKAYRELSKENHPDKLKGLPADEVERRTEFMKEINIANDVLSSEARRKDYNTMLKVRKQMDAPKENEFVVLIGIFLLVTAAVHFFRKQGYESVKKELLKTPRVARVFSQEEDEKTAGMSKKDLKAYKKQRKKEKQEGEEDLDQYDDAVINKVIKEGGLKVYGWNGGKPNFIGSAFVVAKSPITLGMKSIYTCFWVFRFVTGAENDHDRKMDTINKLGFDETFWDGLSKEQQLQYRKQLKEEAKALLKPKQQ